jgi:hypothetical protein
MMNLLSIEEEASACRARCANMHIGDICLHLHHKIFAEILKEPIENRISYILSDKPLAEQPLRLRMMGPPIIDEQVKADAAWLESDAELQKASPALQKADAELQKADAERQKADAAWLKASAVCLKADAELQKADAELQKAEAERQKAAAAWQKADAELQKAYAAWRKPAAAWQKAYEPHYRRLYPDSTWNGHTIFAGKFATLGSDS